MSISWKRIAAGLAIVAGGVGLFFLSTFSFLAMKGRLDAETLVRLPIVGRLFDTDSLRARQIEMAAFAGRMRRMEQSLERLETRLGIPQEAEDGLARLHRDESGSMIFELDPILVNLQGSGGTRFLKSRFTLGIEADDEEGAEEAFDALYSAQNRAVIRDAMLRVCREKSIKDIEADYELDGLKKEIAQAVQNSVFSKRPGRIKEVYINEFLIQ